MIVPKVSCVDLFCGAGGLSREKMLELVPLLEERARRRKPTAVGLVSPTKGHVGTLVNQSGEWQPTDAKPDVYLPHKFGPVLTSRKRFVVVIGGRGSGKSISVGDLCLMDARGQLAKTYCLREYQTSIRNSVHSLLKMEIERLGFEDFGVLQHAITYRGSDAFEFAGLARNADSIKSAHGFRRFWVEEAQSLSEESIQALTPTARNKPNRGLPGDIGEAVNAPNASLVFVANPSSSEDPFSKRFIVPYLSELDRVGYYEDDLHLIIAMNYADNPWFVESGLEKERAYDYDHLPRALYDHIWLGKFNDSVSSALIQAEWFDACVDAHVRLGFEARGAKIAAHDPSDGGDAKGYAMRHGSVVVDIQEKLDGNVNEGGHWAAQIAIDQRVDAFVWDATGMGAGLAEQMSRDFKGKKVELSQFIGAETPDAPDAVYKPATGAPVGEQRKNKDALKNKRTQYHMELRDRVHRTYRAVVHKEFHDPDALISFDSAMPLLSKLRAEVCRLPVKPNSNGLMELYTKEEMRSRFRIASPNLAESVMMSLRHFSAAQQQPYIPKPIKVMGR
jgi:phage terminase large subunit